MPARFRDGYGGIVDDDQNELVQCPRCQGRAEVVYRPFGPSPTNEITRDGQIVKMISHDQHVRHWAAWRVACTACTYQAEPPRLPPGVTRDEARDRAFGLPLWLQTPCAGHVLSAWNERHLDFLERYVAADLRERTPNVNRSLASRLPRWIKSARNRDEVLKGIRRLRARLTEAGPSR